MQTQTQTVSQPTAALVETLGQKIRRNLSGFGYTTVTYDPKLQGFVAVLPLKSTFGSLERSRTMTPLLWGSIDYVLQDCLLRGGITTVACHDRHGNRLESTFRPNWRRVAELLG